MKPLSKHTKKVILVSVAICIFPLTMILILACYIYVELVSRNHTYTSVSQIPERKIGLLLGTNPISRYTKRRNPFYYNRINATVDLYKAGKIKKILISGDNRHKSYSEPDLMKEDLIKQGILEQDIHLDYAGFRTLDSVVRAVKVFGVSEFTVISQEFHNKRAICLAHWQGIDAIGFNAKDISFRKGIKVQLRELLARTKLVWDILTDKQPHFLGTPIKIN